MNKRFLLFMVVMITAFSLNALLMNWLNPPQPPVVQNDRVADEKPDGAPQPDPQPATDADPAAPAPDEKTLPQDQDPPEKPTSETADPPQGEQPEGNQPELDQPQRQRPERWITLGSLDPSSGYRMLVVLTSAGATIDELMLNGGFEDLSHHHRAGYLGPLSIGENTLDEGGGLTLLVVGRGTPLEEAGLLPGDRITAFNDQPVGSHEALHKLVDASRAGKTCSVTFTRGEGKPSTVSAKLATRPLSVITRELNEKGAFDPRSLAFTFSQVDKRRLKHEDVELLGVDLREGNWELLEHTDQAATFSRRLDALGLEVVKRFELARDAEENRSSGEKLENYHLDVSLEIRNIDKVPHDVAYRFDGPTGLPTEGWWYSSKVTGSGSRDVIIDRIGSGKDVKSCIDIANQKFLLTAKDENSEPVKFIGVDAQYFAAMILPLPVDHAESWFADSEAIRAGPVSADANRHRLLNTSTRLVSKPIEQLGPDLVVTHNYRLFVGPKKSALLANYQLEPLLDYGWFGRISTVLLWILHFFHSLTGNFAVSIVMLTILVRGCMFPISRKQALSAQKMQELQPEMKRISEKYKDDLPKKNQELQQLFRRHNHNPLGGCLLVFLQLPIFIGLYRALMIDVELRQAPLASFSSWCNNLAAPDMLFRWDSWMPAFFASETGYLGPYFNLLPIITVSLYLVQQKLFMPPATDEQSALQQKMMMYMTVFMGVFFYKVASGLCVYFIASSLWSIAERKLLPKTLPPKSAVPERNEPAKPSRLASLVERITSMADLEQPGAAGNGRSGNKKSDNKRKK